MVHGLRVFRTFTMQCFSFVAVNAAEKHTVILDSTNSVDRVKGCQSMVRSTSRVCQGQILWNVSHSQSHLCRETHFNSRLRKVLTKSMKRKM